MEELQQSVWKQENREAIFNYGEEYKAFLDEAKTEREAVDYIVAAAKEHGFKNLDDIKEAKAGDKILVNNKGKSVVLFVLGENLEEGLRIVGSHIDSPRLDVKARPLYDDSGLALFKTHYYGGIKKYQWVAMPLAIHGVVFRKDGSKITLNIGERDDDPVFFINDLLPHLGADQMKKTAAEAITGEQLNVVVGHIPGEEEKNPVKALVLKHLQEEYGITEGDFQVAELEVVPAMKARDVGFDRGMVAGYGQDDRVASFANLKAILSVERPKNTVAAIFADKEEIGSVGNTGMSAAFFKNAVAELVALTSEGGHYSELTLRRALAKSKIISADVTAAMDPSFKEVMDDKNSALVGSGVTINKFTGARGKSSASDANAEFLQEVRKILDDAGIIWQTGEMGKVDQGGGGTIAFLLADYGAEVLDMGTAMLSMHAPYELLSKADAYMTYRAYEAFLKA
ncbi:MAG: aminopeptidase [Tissierellia bacterium]|nr:aminopeptidase [Tissierellia bacterium]